MGWSDAGPLPRDAAQFAKELHALLQNANIPGPYVLVGHSLGGFPVRVFTGMYPSEVAGVVLIDSMTPQQFTHSPPEVQSQSDSQSQPLSLPAVLARFGVVRLFVKLLGIVPLDHPMKKPTIRYMFARNIRQATLTNLKGCQPQERKQLL